MGGALEVGGRGVGWGVSGVRLGGGGWGGFVFSWVGEARDPPEIPQIHQLQID